MRWDNLIGVAFLMGQNDCFSMTRNFFDQNFDMCFADYARPIDWDADNLNLIEACFGNEGFEKITHWTAADLRPADVMCMAVGSTNPNHFATFVGDNMMIHHLAYRLSSEEPYRDFWRTATCFVLRHPAIPDLRPVYPDIDLGEILRARLDFASAA